MHTGQQGGLLADLKASQAISKNSLHDSGSQTVGYHHNHCSRAAPAVVQSSFQ